MSSSVCLKLVSFFSSGIDVLFALWDALDLGDNVTLVLHD
jgi:hypothetical protein